MDIIEIVHFSSLCIQSIVLLFFSFFLFFFFSNFYYDSRPCMSVMFTCLFLARKTAAIYKRHSSPADFFLSPPPFHTYIRNVHYPPYNRLLGLCEPFGLLFYFLLFLPTCDLIAELKKKPPSSSCFLSFLKLISCVSFLAMAYSRRRCTVLRCGLFHLSRVRNGL